MSLRPVLALKIDRSKMPAAKGKKAGIVWLDPAKLVVDTRYQRELGDKGVSRVRRIALGFDWRKFTPLIVADLGDGSHAIIDGQHRAAAVLARGDIDRVPAWVVSADLAQQADTFLCINAESARVPNGAMWYARAASGDERAQTLFALCAKAQIQILKWPMDASRRRYDQTLSPEAIASALAVHGEKIVLAALDVLRRAGELSGRCLLTQRFIRAAVLLAKFSDVWRHPSVHVALSDVVVEDVEARASIASRDEGGTRVEHVLRLLREHLDRKIKAVS